MSATATLRQMIVIVLLMLSGLGAQRAGLVSKENKKCLSALVLNVFNPAIILSSMIGNLSGEKQEYVGATFLWAGVIFVFSIVMANIVSKLLTKEIESRKLYTLMLTFSNVGFIGIPVINALFGTSYVLYVAIIIFEYNLLVYTYGYSLIKPKTSDEKGFSLKDLKPLANMGTFACALGLIIFLTGFTLPYELSSAVTYLGNAATPLSMFIIGVNLGEQEKLLALFTKMRTYIFCFVKLIVIPVISILMIKRFPVSETLQLIYTIVFAMPVGSVPSIMAADNGLNVDLCSECTILSTVFSVLSIPVIVLLFGILP